MNGKNHKILTLSVILNFLLLPIIAQDSLFVHPEVRDLARQVTLNDTTEFQKASSVYKWITSNIAYDVRSYLKGITENKDAVDVIKSKKTICKGYALLYQQMARALGLQCYTIKGYLKGIDYFPNQTIRWAEHVWNVVKIGSVWYHVDATNGSGYLIKKTTIPSNILNSIAQQVFPPTKLEFVLSPSDKYFTSDPSKLFASQLAADPVWHLSKCGFDLQSFKNGDSIYGISLCEGNYLDTLSAYIRLLDLYKGVSSAERAKNYNKENSVILADELFKYGNYLFERANSAANITQGERADKFNMAAGIYKESLDNYSNVKKDIKENKKELLRFLKDADKTINKSISAQLKNNQKTIERNKKTLTKNIATKKKLQNQVKKLTALNYAIVNDDKIFDVRTPKPGTLVNSTQVSELVSEINNNTDKIFQFSDSINVIDSEYKKQSTLNKEKIIFSHINLNDANLMHLSQILKLSLECNISNTDSIQQIIEQLSINSDSAKMLKKEIKLNKSVITKENAKKLKAYHSQMKAATKGNKKLLIEIKKLKSASDDEEVLYAIENQRLIDINNQLIERYNAEMLKIKELKEILQQEQHLLKKQSKTAKKILKVQKRVNRYYVNRVEALNKIRRNNNINNIGTVKKRISLCNENVKQLNF